MKTALVWGIGILSALLFWVAINIAGNYPSTDSVFDAHSLFILGAWMIARMSTRLEFLIESNTPT